MLHSVYRRAKVRQDWGLIPAPLAHWITTGYLKGMSSFPIAPDKLALERGQVIAPQFDANGLVAAICQHAQTGEVLMLAWMNAEALQLTLNTGVAHYWSRSRAALWKKGETSGQVQIVDEIRFDCDQDAVLLKVRPQGDGGACHVGFPSCFYRVAMGTQLVEQPDSTRRVPDVE